MGDTVAVIDAYDDPNAEADLAIYRSYWGLPACTSASGCFTKVNQTGTAAPLPAGNAVWESEISLDIDAVSALCPNCHIMLVETNTNADANLYAGIATAQRLGANQISNSWTSSSSSTAPLSFSTAGVIAANGDYGYAGAGTNNYPAAFPGVTAAGGTTLTDATDHSSTRGYSESAWSRSSVMSGGSGCDLSQPKPSYQTDTGCTGRSYADASADGDPVTGIFIYDSHGGSFGWLGMGGTSLSSPLIAAYEAVTHVNGTTPQWAYLDSALLNDPATGSTGTCAQAILYICNAGTGYDGPTGAGSISGAVATGAPGIGGPAGANTFYAVSVGAQTAALTGGVYANGLDTQSFWQYGTTTEYGQQTAPTDIGAGTSPVAAPVSLGGLTPATGYHYRLVAQNSAGTTYGYDFTLTTLGAPPVDSSLPAVSGTAQPGQALSASNGVWSGAPTSYGYQWQRSTDSGSTWSAISGQTGSSYVPVAGDVGWVLRVTVTASNADGSASASSPSVGPVTSLAPAISGGATIGGSALRGQVLTVSSVWNPAGVSYAYQWQRSGDQGVSWTNIGLSATSYTVLVADEGALVRVIVTATNPSGQTSATSMSVGPVASDPPVNTIAPALTGTAQRGYTLSITQGSWSGSGNAYAYQWQRSNDHGASWTSIAGATASTYTLATADNGDLVRALVSGTNPDGTVIQASNPTPQSIAPNPPMNSTLPAITGIVQPGQTLSASIGVWNPAGASYAYQWQRSTDSGGSWSAISGQASSTYVVVLGDVGSLLRSTVTATNPDGSVSASSSNVGPITSGPPAVSGVPTISGWPRRSQVLTVSSVWNPAGVSYAYQWQRSSDNGASWTNIGVGTSAASYTPLQADDGALIRAIVTATNPSGQTSATSMSVGPVASDPPVNTIAPALTGTAQRGYTLSITQGSWSGSGNAYAYQWQRSNDHGASWTSIAGATASTYTLATADETDLVRGLASASNPDGTVIQASNSTHQNIAPNPPANSTLPTISGTAQPGSTLSSSQGSWSGIGNNAGYQWQHSSDGKAWTNMPGATASSYMLAGADGGYFLRILVTATNPDGSVSVASAPTAMAPAAAPISTALPILSSDPGRIGDTLRITPGIWSGARSVTSQMLRCTNICLPSAPLNTRSYILTSADLGAYLFLREIATGVGGQTMVFAARLIGPVISAQAAAAVLSSSPTALRNSRGTTLVTAQLAHVAFIAGHGGRKPIPMRGRTITVRRARHVTGRLTVWACQVSTRPGGRPPPCTARVSLRNTVTLHLPASASGRVRVVVVRRGR